MKCKEIENGRSCPWEDCPDFNNDWCKNCASYEKEPVANQHTCPYYQGVCSVNESYVCYRASTYEECDLYKLGEGIDQIHLMEEVLDTRSDEK